jgi:hypothetical protein
VLSVSYPATVFGNPALRPTDVTAAETTLTFLLSQHLATASFDVRPWVAPGVSSTATGG